MRTFSLTTTLIGYVATAAVLFTLDFIWLTNAVPVLYKPRIGHLLLETPNLAAAAGFYLLYVVGVVAFAVLPAFDEGSLVRAIWGGALLGLVAYGTYDMTNLATLKDWSVLVSVVDMVWGAVVSAAAAVAGVLVLRLFRGA
jgi:uncharacterized membrane protein